MNVAAIQLDVGVDETTDERMARASGGVRDEAANGADVVLLPEMWLRGWFDFDLYPEIAQPADGPAAQAMGALAAETGVVLVAGSIVERDGDDLYNTALVFDRDGSPIVAYRKIHLFSFETARESEVVSPGTDIVTFDLEGARAGLSICYDLRFPELYRRQMEDGAEILLIVSAWPYPRIEAWRTLLRARAIENQAALVACNAAGQQSVNPYGGHSAAYDAWGECLGELGADPGVLRATIDLEAVRAARATFPALRDRALSNGE